MNAVQSALASARLNRLVFWISVAVLVAGAVTLAAALAGGSDKTSVSPQKGFKPTLPAKSQPLKNAQGVLVKNYWQLDPQIRNTIRTVLGTAVSRRHLGDSWAVVAPVLRKGYTYNQWAHAKALPIIPYPVADLDQVQYYLDYASTKEILVEVGVSAKKSLRIRPTTFQLALSPVGTGANARWMVNYWMPRWTPPVPEG
jgi:hypothetical protein